MRFFSLYTVYIPIYIFLYHFWTNIDIPLIPIVFVEAICFLAANQSITCSTDKSEGSFQSDLLFEFLHYGQVSSLYKSFGGRGRGRCLIATGIYCNLLLFFYFGQRSSAHTKLSAMKWKWSHWGLVRILHLFVNMWHQQTINNKFWKIVKAILCFGHVKKNVGGLSRQTVYIPSISISII